MKQTFRNQTIKILRYLMPIEVLGMCYIDEPFFAVFFLVVGIIAFEAKYES